MKFKYLIGIVAVIALTAPVLGIQERCCCIDDHGGPPPDTSEGEQIGRVAGYTAFALFLDDGGYSLDQTTIETIEGWNADYQETEYDPRQAEANDIREWLDARHVMDGDCTCGDYHATMATWKAERDAKIANLHELDAEIDAEWAELADAIRALVSDEDYTDFLDAH